MGNIFADVMEVIAWLGLASYNSYLAIAIFIKAFALFCKHLIAAVLRLSVSAELELRYLRKKFLRSWAKEEDEDSGAFIEVLGRDFELCKRVCR